MPRVPGFTDRLEVCTRRSGLSPALVADLTGVAHLEEIHAGGQSPSSEELTALAGVYGTTAEWLRDADPKVMAWEEFRKSTWFQETNLFAAGYVQRTAAVLHYLNSRYPGHLTYTDVADNLHLTDRPVLLVLTGQPVRFHFLEAFSKLCGIGTTWLLFGEVALAASQSSPSSADQDISRALKQLWGEWLLNRGWSSTDPRWKAYGEVLTLLAEHGRDQIIRP